MSAGFQLRRPLHLCAVGFGLGLSPVAPGTVGTLAALPFYVLLMGLPPWVYLAVVALLGVVGVSICGRAAADVGVPDHSSIVWDEIVGFLVAAWPLVWGVGLGHVVVDVLAVFLLFRFFDAVKPWPICVLDRRLHGGVGIMADDIAAGAAAALVLIAAAAFFGG